MGRTIRSFVLVLLWAPAVFAASDDPLLSFYTIRERAPVTAWFRDPVKAVAFLAAEVKTLANIDLLAFDYHGQPFPQAREAYNRMAHFGGWVNDRRDQTCYNTRAKVLIRDSKRQVTFNPSNRCVVAGGEWHEPYGGNVHTQAGEIEIDHVVALKNAYISGAHRWDFRSRCLYANYLGNDFHLLSVDSSENRSKSDKTPADWMPSDRRDSCSHLSNWLRVKLIWGLVLGDRETRAIQGLARQSGCDARWFQITAYAVAQQRDIMQRNLNLCDKDVN